MRAIAKHLLEITYSAGRDIAYFLKFNLRYFVTWLNMLLPYSMYYIGKAQPENDLVVLWIPVTALIVLHYIREFANRNNVGNAIPVPQKRFTQVDEDGEVTIENRRLQELILYLADLEDWLHRKGLL